MEVRSIEAIIRALNAVDVKYLIVGGIAVNAHGYERLTQDIDLVIGLQPDNIVRGLNALLTIDYHLAIPVTPEEFAERGRREEWRREKGMVVLKLWSDAHRRTPIDVFIYEPSISRSSTSGRAGSDSLAIRTRRSLPTMLSSP